MLECEFSNGSHGRRWRRVGVGERCRTGLVGLVLAFVVSALAAGAGAQGRSDPPLTPTYQGPLWYVAVWGDDANPGTDAQPFRSIQRGLDAASDGHSVLLAPGRYRGDGNRDLDFRGKAVVVASLAGAPDSCVVDAEGHVGFTFRNGESLTSSLVALTIEGASTAIVVARPAGAPVPFPKIEACVLDACETGIDVGGSGSRVFVSGCTVRDGTTGMVFRDGARGGRVEQTQITGHRADGVVTRGVPTLDDFDALVLANCELDHNRSGLRHLAPIGHVRLDGCHLHDNAEWGAISVASQDRGLTVDGGTVRRNGAGGINTAGSQWDQVARCEISDNGGPGVVTSWDIAFGVTDCIIHGNAGHGLSFSSGRDQTRVPWQPVTISGCRISANGGSGIEFASQSLHDDNRVVTCVIYGNAAAGISITAPYDPDDGSNARVIVEHCTIANNATGVAIASTLPTRVESSLVAFNGGAAIDGVADQDVLLACSNLFGNVGGDWSAAIAPQFGHDGNLGVDPRCCDPERDDYTLRDDSPCAPDHHPDGADCGGIGALGVACTSIALPYTENFEDGTADHFTVVSGAWEVVDGHYRCLTRDPLTPSLTCVGDPAWADYRVDCDLRAFGAATQRLLFRYRSPDDYYLLELAPAPANRATLRKREGGTERVLLQVEGIAGEPDAWRHLAVGVRGAAIAAVVDGADLFRFVDAATPYLTGKVGFLCVADTAYGWQEVAVDNVCVAALSPPNSVCLPTISAGNLRSYPNPFNPHTHITFDLAEAGPAFLAVYDLKGRLIRTLHEGALGAGDHAETWDGRDDTGRQVAAGTYFCRLQAPEGTRSTKLNLVR